ncbi:MAG TPA: crosslink repair DNA glycosylase YcaQ family protein, partial [Candidatus Limnocylindrales bacterium]|nr:crosslink repair DNA glycosylase YcaQ family protein [Candidatus Limnocylindrales bacterium]
PPPDRNARGRLEALGLTQRDAGRIRDEIAAAVEGRRLTLPELEAAVGERLGSHVTVRRGSAFGSGWSLVRSFVGEAALAGALCFGPNEGNRVTFVRPNDWVGLQAPVDERDALATVVRRYLRVYGPATIADFRQWTATTTDRARAAFDTVLDELVEVRVEGTRGWWLPEALEAMAGGGAPRGGEPAVQLLGHFDVYCVGSRPRDVLVPPPVQAAVADRGLSRANLHANVPVLVVDGRVAGLWQREVRSRGVVIRVEPIGQELAVSLRTGIEEAAERVGRVLERPPSVTFGRVEARPHM